MKSSVHQESRKKAHMPSMLKRISKNNTELDNMLVMMEKLLHWAAIIESSDDAIISKSIDGYITSWNKGAEALYGYKSAEIIGQPVSILMPPGYKSDFPLIMGKLHKGEKVEHYETKRQTKNGKVIDVSLTVSPIRDTQGNIIGASKIARDITERVENEKRRDEFISTASHELKTPITSQKAFGELLERLIKKNEDIEYLPYIQKINKQTDKLTKLIEDLLEVSRVRRGRLRLENILFPLHELIDEIVESIQLTTSIKIECKDIMACEVKGDRERIGQVLTNIISNAIKYAPNTKKIVVRSIIKNNEVHVSVQDFGIGIDEKFHKKIFEQFFRVIDEDEKTYPGMGIGLHLSQEIISRHGGKIWVTSEKGKGSIFSFSLPLKNK
jgi:PAS domain S-box-containing protein